MAQINILKTSASLVQTPPEGFTAMFVDENSRLRVIDDTGASVNLNVLNASTASYAATASSAVNALTASRVTSASLAVSASYANRSFESNYAISASYALIDVQYAMTASTRNSVATYGPSSSYSQVALSFQGTLNNAFEFRFPDKKDSSTAFGRAFSANNRLLSSGQSERWPGYVLSGQFPITYPSPLAQNPPPSWNKIYTSKGNIFALGGDGYMYVAGDNTSGQLGNGTTTTEQILVRLAALSGSGKSVVDFWAPVSEYAASGTGNMYVIAKVNDNGTYRYYGWGDNALGQLGIGSTTSPTTPTEITSVSGSDFTRIATLRGNTFFISSSGLLLAAGTNTNGNLGVGNTTTQTTPTPCLFSDLTTVSTCEDVAVTEAWSNSTTRTGWSTFLKTTDGKIYGAGYNASNNLGINNTTQQLRFTPIIVNGIAGSQDIQDIQGSQANGLALNTSGSLIGWGPQPAGHFGIGSTTTFTTGSTIQTGVQQFWFIRKGRTNQQQLFFNKLVGSTYVTYAAGYNGNYSLGVGSTSTNVTTAATVRFPINGEYAVQVQGLGSLDDSGTPFMGTMFLTNLNRIYVTGRIDVNCGNVSPLNATLISTPVQVTDIPF